MQNLVCVFETDSTPENERVFHLDRVSVKFLRLSWAPVEGELKSLRNILQYTHILCLCLKIIDNDQLKISFENIFDQFKFCRVYMFPVDILTDRSIPSWI